MSRGKRHRRGRGGKRSGPGQGSSDKSVPENPTGGSSDSGQGHVSSSGRRQEIPTPELPIMEKTSNNGDTVGASPGGSGSGQGGPSMPSNIRKCLEDLRAACRVSFEASMKATCGPERKKHLLDASNCIKTIECVKALLRSEPASADAAEEIMKRFFGDELVPVELPPSMPAMETTGSETNEQNPLPATTAVGSAITATQGANEELVGGYKTFADEVSKSFWTVADMFDAMGEDVKRKDPQKVIMKAGTLVGRCILLHLACIGGYTAMVAEILKDHPFLVESTLEERLVTRYRERKQSVESNSLIARFLKTFPPDVVCGSTNMEQPPRMPRSNGYESNTPDGLDVGQPFPGGPPPVLIREGLDEGIQPEAETDSQQDK